MKDLKLKRFETCDYALISQEGKLSVIGIFDRIFVQTLPAQHPSMAFVVVAEGAPKSDYKVKLLITGPAGNKIQEIPMNVKTNDAGYFNVIANLNNVPITEQGIMKVEFYDGDEKLATREIVITTSPVLRGSKTKN